MKVLHPSLTDQDLVRFQEDTFKYFLCFRKVCEAEHAGRAVGMRVWPQGTEVRIIAVDDGPAKRSYAH